MRVDIEKCLQRKQISQAWELYTAAFAELRVAAVQRHVMNRDEFDQVMTDERVSKYMAVNPADSRIAGLATFTNDLDSMPLISPDYFAHRWPTWYAARRIWYLGFFAVAPAFRGSGIFEAVIDRMWDEVRAGGGVAALDICGYNATLGLPTAIQRTLESLTPQVMAEQMDVQGYYAYILSVME